MKTKVQVYNFIEETMTMTGVKVQWLSEPYQDLDKIDLGFRSRYLKYANTDEAMISEIHKLKPNCIYFSSDIFKCNYVGFVLKNGKDVCIVGPVLYELVTEKNLLELEKAFNFDDESKTAIYNYYSEIPLVSSRNLFENLFIALGKKLYGKELEIVHNKLDDFFESNSIIVSDGKENKFTDFETMYRYNEIENELLLAVASGNEAEAMDVLKRGERRIDVEGMDALKDVRQYKNNAIALNALIRKSIEQENIHPYKCNYIAERFMLELEQCANIEQVRTVQRKMIVAYCRTVQYNSYEKHSQMIARVLAWIDMDLSSDLTLKSFSKALNVNASYLSKVFSKEMGMTLTEYVNTRRINKACRLLENTNLKLESIARQCGFSNAHYFIRQFKKYMNTTPSAYREENIFMDQKEIFKRAGNDKK